jgi:hypothetical protein
MIKLLLAISGCTLTLATSISAQNLVGWSSRETLQISEQSGSTLSNYQVKITVLMQAGMANDFSDIRFTDSDGTTLLSYWQAFYEAGVSATFWVKIPLLIANSQKTIYLYFDNPLAVSASNGQSTFIFYNDMRDANQWNTVGGGLVSVDSTSYPGNYLIKKQGSCDPSGAWIPLGSNISNFRLISRELRVDINNCKWNRYGLENTAFDGYSLRRKASVNTVGEFGFERRTGGQSSQVSQTVLPQPRGQFYRTEMVKDCTNGRLQVSLLDDDGNLIGRKDGIDNAFCNFNRFVMRGGLDYYFDNVAVGQYTTDEPIVTFMNQLILLPLELHYFDATKVENGHLIEWEIGQTDDILHFEIEYSLNAIDFEQMHVFSVQGLNYEILDKNYYTSEQVYYRLKTVMTDASIVYSDIKVLAIEGQHQGVSLAPNPTRSYMNVRFYLDKESEIHLILMDNSGRKVRSMQQQLSRGSQALEINTSELKAGLYHLVLADGLQHRVRRFIKQ